MKAYSKAFQGRLAALARVHDMITGDRDESDGLLQIVCAELEAHGARPGKDFRVDGPHVELEPRQAQGLILAVHELVTNALRYGALHHKDGTIEVEWNLTPTGRETRLNLTWGERGVPRSQAAPEKGFGRAMIDENLPRMLKGAVEFAFPRGRCGMPHRVPTAFGSVIVGVI